MEIDPDIDGPFFVQTRCLRSILDPFIDDAWGHGPITYDGVSLAIKDGVFETRENTLRNRAVADRPYDDVGRVAHFVVNFDPSPLLLEINSDCGEDVVIADGCHRLASAIYSGRPYLLVSYGGFCDGFRRGFPKRRLPSQKLRNALLANGLRYDGSGTTHGSNC